VIKIGSRVLTAGGGLNLARIAAIVGEVSRLRTAGRQVVIVSSGAIAAGRTALGLSELRRTIPQKQAAAAVGQTRLMRAYEDACTPHGLIVAQILLTGDDLGHRLRFQNARAAIDELIACGAIPIINENDTVAVDEIKFGDNDNLSALVANLVEADLLVILTDIDGFYDADPRTHPDACLVPLVRAITREVERAAGGTGSSIGTGGMATKIAAAKKAGKFGAPTVMLNGTDPANIGRAFAGEEVGTLFLPDGEILNRRKHWIAHTLHPHGRLYIDAGASRVLSQKRCSLLATGIIRVEGEFERGTCVRIISPDGAEIARGLVDYASSEIYRILGRKSSEIADILGYHYGDEVVHRENLVLL
jgi:glutamate 5-kinase